MTHVRGRRAFQGTLADLDGVQARLADISPWTYDHTDWLTAAGLTVAP